MALDTLTLGDAGPDPVDWPIPDGGTHPLLPMVVSDQLLVDTARSCSGDGGFAPSYLDIEREIYLGGSPHTTCGGRTPDEDVVDETLTLLVTDGRAPGEPGRRRGRRSRRRRRSLTWRLRTDARRLYAATRRRSSTRISSKLGASLPRARQSKKRAWWTSASSGGAIDPSSRLRSHASA